MPRGPAPESARSTSSRSRHAEAIVRGAETASRAAILQISQKRRAYHGALAPIAAATVAGGPGGVRAGCCPPRSRDRARPGARGGVAGPRFGHVRRFGAGVRGETSRPRRPSLRNAMRPASGSEAELGEVGGKTASTRPAPVPTRTRRSPTSRPPAWTRWRCRGQQPRDADSRRRARLRPDRRAARRPAGAARAARVLRRPDDGLRQAVERGIVKVNIAPS